MPEGDNNKPITLLLGLERVVKALALAGIHAADCAEGQRNFNQMHTGAYLTHQPCTCWVESKGDVSTYICD